MPQGMTSVGVRQGRVQGNKGAVAGRRGLHSRADNDLMDVDDERVKTVKNGKEGRSSVKGGKRKASGAKTKSDTSEAEDDDMKDEHSREEEEDETHPKRQRSGGTWWGDIRSSGEGRLASAKSFEMTRRLSFRGGGFLSPLSLRDWGRADLDDSLAGGIKIFRDCILSPVASIAALAPSMPGGEHGSIGFRDYMMGEVSSRFDHSEQQHEPLGTTERRSEIPPFMRVPLKLEYTLNVGFLVCLDSFLFNFTLLPLRCLSDVLSCSRAFLLHGAIGGPIPEDLRRMMLVVVCLLSLNHVDISYLYHYIRGQMSSYIKLYVIYNVLEVFDRLFCSLGQDVFEHMSAICNNQQDLKNQDGTTRKQNWFWSLFYVPLSIVYMIGHSTVLLIQVVVLNVAINSNNNALITLLVANNFTEIKVRSEFRCQFCTTPFFASWNNFA